MERMLCEACGSPYLMLESGVYVCKACGTKYKDTMASRLENLLTLARCEMEVQNLKEAGKYYTEAKVLAPHNWEIAYFSALYNAVCSAPNDRGAGLFSMSRSLDGICEIVLTQISEIKEQRKICLIMVGHINYWEQNKIPEIYRQYKVGKLDFDTMIETMAGYALLLNSAARIAASYFYEYLMAKRIFENGIFMFNAIKETKGFVKIFQDGLDRIRLQAEALEKDPSIPCWRNDARRD